MYVPFPSLAAGERLDRASEVEASLVRLTPADAILASANAQPIDRIRLIARLGRPLYVVQPRGRAVSAVWADSGSSAEVQRREEVQQIASRFSGAGIHRIDGPLDFDQWVVHQAFDWARPYFRVHIDDEQRTVIYVSQRSGEVLQRTTGTERKWNYVGAVAHWIYPTVLRRHWAAWDQVVWWLSLAGIAVVTIGIWLGIDRMLIALRTKRAKITLYRGWMKWHHILGLCASVVVLTWIFSGWLSMDHGRIFPMPDATAQQVDRFRGISLREAAQKIGIGFIRELGSFRELDIKAIADTPLAIVLSRQNERIYAVDSGQRLVGASIPPSLIQAGVQNAWSDAKVQHTGHVTVDDNFRKVRQSKLPESTIRVQLDDSRDTWVHVDAASGEIVSVMDRSRRVYRWLYHGLHSLDFPGLVNRRPMWDVVMLSLLTLGFSFSVTGAFLGARRLKRALTPSKPNP
jgi:hypothetical protein